MSSKAVRRLEKTGPSTNHCVQMPHEGSSSSVGQRALGNALSWRRCICDNSRMAHDRPAEKRNYVRIDKAALVSFEIYPNAEPPLADMGVGRTIDVSLGGIQLELPRSVTVGDGVRMVLDIQGNLIPAIGRVVRTEIAFGGFVLAGIRLTKVGAEYASLVALLQAHE